MNEKLQDEKDYLIVRNNGGLIFNIEEKTLQNESYRKVIFTTSHSQVVLMSIIPGDEIPGEVHKKADQFIRIESGEAVVTINEEIYDVLSGNGILVAAGAKHKIENRGKKDLKLYTVYTSPQHGKNIIEDLIEDVNEN